MCLYPTLIKNRKYTKNKKNGGNVPAILDPRTAYVPVGCGKCIECKKQKARQWQVRLHEEIKTSKNGKMITLTFSDESISELVEYEKEFKNKETGEKYKKTIKQFEGYKLDNLIATVAVRLFMERWRKKYKKTLRHWLVTELGHKGTKNIHLHGIIWTDENMDTVEKIWKYGFIWKGYEKNGRIENYVNEKTVNYCVKYINKIDKEHKAYNSIVLTSPGIGSNYTNTYNSQRNEYNGKKTDETYITRTGHKMTIPIYYRNKLYTEEERERLWIHKLDKEERWVRGERVSLKDGIEEYTKLLAWHREKNIELGYGTNERDWNREKYEHEIRKLLHQTRIQNGTNK